LLDTAFRETHEEVGIGSSSLALDAELEQHATRGSQQVKPFVAYLKEDVELALNPGEIDSAFWLPLELIKHDRRDKTHVFKLKDKEYWAPVYLYQGYEVWGFTARVLMSFARRYYGASFGQSYARNHASAPEEYYKADRPALRLD
jgi:hypothetical protein